MSARSKSARKALGPDHPNTAASLNNLAGLYGAMGDPKEALRLAVQARRVQEKNLSGILSFTSEQQRLAFQKTTNPYSLPGTLGNAPELAEVVLRQKGVVLDSLLEDRLVAEASGDPRQREIIEQLRAATQRLTQLQLEVPKDLSEQAQKRRTAEKGRLSTEVSIHIGIDTSHAVRFNRADMKLAAPSAMSLVRVVETNKPETTKLAVVAALLLAAAMMLASPAQGDQGSPRTDLIVTITKGHIACYSNNTGSVNADDAPIAREKIPFPLEKLDASERRKLVRVFIERLQVQGQLPKGVISINGEEYVDGVYFTFVRFGK